MTATKEVGSSFTVSCVLFLFEVARQTKLKREEYRNEAGNGKISNLSVIYILCTRVVYFLIPHRRSYRLCLYFFTATFIFMFCFFLFFSPFRFGYLCLFWKSIFLSLSFDKSQRCMHYFVSISDLISSTHQRIYAENLKR